MYVKKNCNVQGKEHENFGPNAGWVRKRVGAERFKRGQDDKNGRPPMVEGERQVYEYFVGGVRGCMILLHDVVDVLREKWVNRRSYRKGKTLTVTALLTNNAKMNART